MRAPLRWVAHAHLKGRPDASSRSRRAAPHCRLQNHDHRSRAQDGAARAWLRGRPHRQQRLWLLALLANCGGPVAPLDERARPTFAISEVLLSTGAVVREVKRFEPTARHAEPALLRGGALGHGGPRADAAVPPPTVSTAFLIDAQVNSGSDLAIGPLAGKSVRAALRLEGDMPLAAGAQAAPATR